VFNPLKVAISAVIREVSLVASDIAPGSRVPEC
jgi:hypothetical protein